MAKKIAVSFGNMLKNAGLQGSTLSGHRMTTGFGPFELTLRTQSPQYNN